MGVVSLEVNVSRAPLGAVRGALLTTCLIGVCLIYCPTSATAQSRVEVGATLFNVTTYVGDDENATILSTGTAGFELLNPGVYGSFFLGRRVAISPQVGFLLAKSGGSSFHVVNLVGQVEYFTRGSDRSSPYVFGTAGIVEVSESSRTPKSVGGGVGYRARVGDRLTVRVDGRFTHVTGGSGSNAIGIGLALGGLFGQ